MKKLLLFPVIVLLMGAGADALQQLGVSPADLQSRVFGFVAYGNFQVPAGARKLDAPARVEAAKAVLGLARDYTRSADFRTRYDKWWKDSEPARPQTVADRARAQAEEEARSRRNADEGEASMRRQIAETSDPKLKKALQDGLKAFQDAKKQMESPDMKKMMEQGKAMQAEADKQRYEDELKKYNADHAAWMAKKDPNSMVHQQLKAYLDTLQTVDFNAQTVKVGALTEFTNPEHKAKPRQWKLIYRAGKDLNQVGKAFATQWLAELK